MANGLFQQGHDPRRNLGGRAPTARGLRAMVRKKLAADASAIVDRTCAMARSGDPHAIIAAAVLLAAVIQQRDAVPEATE